MISTTIAIISAGIMLVLILLVLSGCDPSIITEKTPKASSLVMSPACLFLCNNGIDNIGETNARGVDSFTGQTSTRSNSIAGGAK